MEGNEQHGWSVGHLLGTFDTIRDSAWPAKDQSEAEERDDETTTVKGGEPQ